MTARDHAEKASALLTPSREFGNRTGTALVSEAQAHALTALALAATDGDDTNHVPGIAIKAWPPLPIEVKRA